MKIGIITFHFPYNCGAVLQCAALQTRLENAGHEVCVINYRPWYHQNRYTPLKNPVYYSGKCMKKRVEGDTLPKRLFRGADGFARTVYSWRRYKGAKAKNVKFESFIKRTLHETRVYRTISKLQNKPPKCDVYISGSDQLWNPHLTEGKLDPAYCLKFGEKKITRMSYAISPNFKEVADPVKLIGDLLDDFDAISLREGKYAETVGKAAKSKDINICVDPVFLLDAEEYEDLISKEPLESEPFIFTYAMPDVTQHKVYNAAKLLSEEKGIKVIDASGNPSKVNAKVKDNRVCGPDEFLWYIKNAEYVITNSFHGTAFSLVYRKNFMVIPHSKTGNRAMEILDTFKLSSCYTDTGVSAAKKITKSTDYSEAGKHMDEIRDKSLKYLFDNIGRKKG